MRIGRARAAHLRAGRRGEALAVRLLEADGCAILTRNFRVKAGELDIVARDGATLLFVEVKTLRREGVYRPADNLSPRQRARNFRAARWYWRMIGSPRMRCRFDLVEVVLSRWGARSIRRIRDYLPPLDNGGDRFDEVL